MCGIIGYSGSENAVPKILEGLSALEYRGYDSAGIAVFDSEKTIKVVKLKGRLALLEEKIAHLESKLVSNCGIGHTRWATHGEPSDVNSHPHGTARVSIVHNGIIENYSVLNLSMLEKEKVWTLAKRLSRRLQAYPAEARAAYRLPPTPQARERKARTSISTP